MNDLHDRAQPLGDFDHVSDVLGDVLKEIVRRGELHARLTAELGRPPTDSEFLTIAEGEALKL